MSMDYVTLNEEERERISYETVQTLAVDQFEEAVGDDTIDLGDDQLKTLLHSYEADHLRQSIRDRVGPDFPAPPGGPAAVNAGLIEELERRITVLRKRLKL